MENINKAIIATAVLSIGMCMYTQMKQQKLQMQTQSIVLELDEFKRLEALKNEANAEALLKSTAVKQE